MRARLHAVSIDYFFAYAARNPTQAPLAPLAPRARQRHPDHRCGRPRHLRTARAAPSIDDAPARRIRRASSDPHQGAPRRSLAWHRRPTLALAAPRQRRHSLRQPPHCRRPAWPRRGGRSDAHRRSASSLPEEWVANSRIGGKSTTPSKIMRLAHDHMASDIAIDIEIGARKAGVPFKSHLDILSAAPLSTRLQK